MDYAGVKDELTKDGEIITHILEKWASGSKGANVYLLWRGRS